MSRAAASVFAATCLSFLLLLPPPSGAQGEGERQPPKPGPNHRMLQRQVGTWKADISMYGEPGKPPVTGEGKAQTISVSGGLWVQTTFVAKSPIPMEGHSFEGYDEAKKKFVGVWIDSWSTAFATSEGTITPDGKKLTWTLTAPDSTGAMKSYATTTEWTGPDTYVWKLFPTPEPAGEPQLEITYTRM